MTSLQKKILIEQENNDANTTTTKTTNNQILYDTPGVVHPYNITNCLNTDELKLTIPSKRITPITYKFHPGKSLFLGGLCRIDFIEGPVSIFVTCFVSSVLPIHNTNTDKAEEVYNNLVGATLQPPVNKERVATFGPFVNQENVTFNGITMKRGCGDIVFPGIGWVCIAGYGEMKFKVHTVEKLGIFIREQPLMPFEAEKVRRKKLAKRPRNLTKGYSTPPLKESHTKVFE